MGGGEEKYGGGENMIHYQDGREKKERKKYGEKNGKRKGEKT